jgi:hypothetical protein
MRRRDFVKAMMAASVAAKTMLGQQKETSVAASDADDPEVARARGLMEMKPLPMTLLVPDAVADTSAHFFTERQMATLRRLSEILMPPLKGYPGAVDAGAPEFLDFLIGASPLDRQEMYRFGLDRLDTESSQQFGVAFAAAGKGDADKLLRPWLRVWMPDHPPTELHARFINVAHMDIRTATINSQAWNQALIAAGRKDREVGVYWFPVEADTYRDHPTSLHLSARSTLHS